MPMLCFLGKLEGKRQNRTNWPEGAQIHGGRLRDGLHLPASAPFCSPPWDTLVTGTQDTPPPPASRRLGEEDQGAGFPDRMKKWHETRNGGQTDQTSTLF